MPGRRWDARIDGDALVLRRRRFLPWRKPEERSVPLTAVVDVRAPSLADWSRRRARVTVHGPAFYDVLFQPESWARAGLLNRRHDVPSHPAPAPAPRPPVARTRRPRARAVRAGDDGRNVWLWRQDGRIHGSLVPVGGATPHRLDPAGLARLLLAEPTKAMPAIRALSGEDDEVRALSAVRGWLSPTARVVDLPAADGAGRRGSEAMPKPAGMAPDGSVRTVSGGLPGLGKRHS